MLPHNNNSTNEKGIEYLLVEGMDLAGKSTLNRKLVEDGLFKEKRHNSICESGHNEIYLFTDKLRLTRNYTPEILGPMYVSALLEDIRNFSYPKVPTVQDSTIILRSLAFNKVMGIKSVVRSLEEVAEKHPKFSRAVLLTADIKTRQKRLQMRINEAPETVAEDDLMVLKKPEKFIAMEQYLVSFGKKYFHTKVIDTTDLSPDEVMKIALA